MNFGALSRGFGTCCLRFTSGVATTHAKLASGWLARLYREGVEPSGSLQKVSDHMSSSFSGLILAQEGPTRAGSFSSWPTSRPMPGAAGSRRRSRRSRSKRSSASMACSTSSAASMVRAPKSVCARGTERAPCRCAGAWLRQQRSRLSNSSAVAGPIDYMLRRWDRFIRFIHDGRICRPTTRLRALRGFALGRKLVAVRRLRARRRPRRSRHFGLASTPAENLAAAKKASRARQGIRSCAGGWQHWRRCSCGLCPPPGRANL